MADAVTVTLGKMGDRARAYIEEGRYASMSEVVRAGLKALEREEAQIDAIMKAKVAEAVAANGPYISLDEAFDRLMARLEPKE